MRFLNTQAELEYKIMEMEEYIEDITSELATCTDSKLKKLLILDWAEATDTLGFMYQDLEELMAQTKAEVIEMTKDFYESK